MHFQFNFNFISFFKIAFSKSIRLTTLLFKDSYVRNNIALSDLIYLILENADAKLLKNSYSMTSDNN